MTGNGRWAWGFGLVATGLAVGLAGQQAPTFRSTAELVVVDATVVTRDGTPIEDLRLNEFEVSINGQRRAVVSAEFVRLTGAVPDDPDTAVSHPRVDGTPAGRLIVIAIDEHSVPPGAQAAAREAAARIVDGADPADTLALVAMPGPLSVGPTRDHAAVRAAVGRVAGRRVDAPRVSTGLSPSELVALRARESVTTAELLGRACGVDAGCRQAAIQEATFVADALEQQGLLTISGLRGVLETLANVPGRKHLFLVSAGLPTSTTAGGRPNLTAETLNIARSAAEANVSLYVFYLNIHFLQSFSVATGWRSPSAVYDDISFFANGLERFADSGGGSFFQVEVDADPFVRRAFRETAAAYVIAVRADPKDRDGRDHHIRVSVSRRDAVVRHRRVIRMPSGS